MASDSTRGRAVHASTLLFGAALVVGMVLSMASAASARPVGGGHNGPRIVPRVATFTIPANSPPTTIWTLNVWKHGTLVGSDTGTSGVLSVTVPRTVAGDVQADVRRNGHWFSGNRQSLPGSGGGGSDSGGAGHGGKGKGNGSGHHHGGGSGPGGSGTGGSTSGGGSSTGGGTTSGGSGTSGGSTGSGSTGSGTTGSGGSLSSAAPTIGSGSSGGASGALDPASATAGASHRVVTASELAFTGAGSDFWSTALGGLGLFLLGAYLMIRRRALRSTPPV